VDRADPGGLTATGKDALGRADQPVRPVPHLIEPLKNLLKPILEPVDRVLVLVRPAVTMLLRVRRSRRTRGPRRTRRARWPVRAVAPESRTVAELPGAVVEVPGKALGLVGGPLGPVGGLFGLLG